VCIVSLAKLFNKRPGVDVTNREERFSQRKKNEIEKEREREWFAMSTSNVNRKLNLNQAFVVKHYNCAI
jgi:hypothetical protein